MRRNQPKNMIKAHPHAFRRSISRLRNLVTPESRAGGNRTQLEESAAPHGQVQTTPDHRGPVPRPQGHRNRLRSIRNRISTFLFSSPDQAEAQPPEYGNIEQSRVQNRAMETAHQPNGTDTQNGDIKDDDPKKRYTIELKYRTESHTDPERALTESPASSRSGPPGAQSALPGDRSNQQPNVLLRTPVPIQRHGGSRSSESDNKDDYYTEIPQTEYHEIPKINTDYDAISPSDTRGVLPQCVLDSLKKRRVQDVLANSLPDSDSDEDSSADEALDIEIRVPKEGIEEHRYVNSGNPTGTPFGYVNIAALDEIQRGSQGSHVKPYITVDEAKKKGILRDHLPKDGDSEAELSAISNKEYVSVDDITRSLATLPPKHLLRDMDAAPRAEIQSVMPP